MNDSLSPLNFPYSLPYEFGEIKAAQEECPGVYYISALPPDTELGMTIEYYAVVCDSQIISDAALAYGEKVAGEPDLYLFDLDHPDNGHRIIEYEIALYQTTHGICNSNDKTALQASRYAMEYHPEYFGEIPPPTHTPWGEMTRYRTLIPGVFWIETDSAVTCISIFYPIWEGDLSDYAQNCAKFLGSPTAEELEEKMPYAFYDATACCLPIFELYKGSRALEPSIDYPKLTNSIWKHYPDYAALWNLREQLGMNDISTLVLQEMGIHLSNSERQNDTINISPVGDDNFFSF